MPDPQIMLVPIPPRRVFCYAHVHNAAIAAGVVGGGVLIGMAGYHRLGGLGWEESFYYASMILSGEGPPPDPQPRRPRDTQSARLRGLLRAFQRRDVHYHGRSVVRAGFATLSAPLPSGDCGARRARRQQGRRAQRRLRRSAYRRLCRVTFHFPPVTLAPVLEWNRREGALDRASIRESPLEIRGYACSRTCGSRYGSRVPVTLLPSFLMN